MAKTANELEHSPLRMSFEEFLEWADEGTWAEWVDGEVQFMSPISDPHQELSLFLIRLVTEFVEERSLGIVRYEPFLMRTGPSLPARSPDLFFLSTARLPLMKRTYLDGPADVAVEVISPESEQRDRFDKYREYEQGGVREYWLIDPRKETATFYTLTDSGYEALPMRDSDQFHSRALQGFRLRLEWLWQRPLPTLRAVRQEWGFL